MKRGGLSPSAVRPSRRLLARVVLLLVLLVAGGAAWGYYAWISAMPRGRIPVTLVRCSDGDTVVLRDRRGRQYSVRLYGIDTPELGAADGFMAALFTATSLEQATRIELEPEGRSTWGGRFKMAHDKYGRVLGWVWYTDAAGRERLLNEVLVRDKQAVLYHKTPQGKYGARLHRAAQSPR